MSKNYSHPELNDNDFQNNIYHKREFYYHKIPKRKEFKDKKEIEEYRNDMCKGEMKLREPQIILSNFLSPDFPYEGLLIMHGTGTGKTCTAISIAEQYKEQIKKYNTKIYVLASGTNIKENFKNELLFCTGNTYLKNKELLDQMTNEEIERERKLGIFSSLQYYKIISYKTFYRKVLGEKISVKKLKDDKNIKSKYKKNEEGVFEREVVIDKISNLDNSLIIVDEAHNLSGNEYGEALKLIRKKSKNLKIVLLTATPMKNKADDIIDILNFIRPLNEPIKRDKVFTSDKNHMMDFKEGGKEYLKKMSNGLISFFRGNMPYTFADRVDKGTLSNGLLFTPVIKCKMNNFQLKAYNKSFQNKIDSLVKSTSAVANFVYPGLDSNNNIIGFYSSDGLNNVLNQLTNNKDKLLKNINKYLFNNKIDKDDFNNFMMESPTKNITGMYLKLKYLKLFSSKFHECLTNLNNLIDKNKNLGTAFIYSNLVHAGGVELFAEVLKVNGYLEFKENKNNYIINNNTIDSRTGYSFLYFKKNNLNMNEFKPSTFLLVTGTSEDGGDEISEEKQKIIRTVFNNQSNKEGKFLKFILGSRVMSEGVTLINVKEVHILDVHYNLGRVEQVIGRAIRMCQHLDVITKDNFFPKVNVYRYVISLNNSSNDSSNKLSSDEILYQKAEKKYLLVKKTERIIKEASFDCPLLLNGNKFPEEIEKYKNCVEPSDENIKKGKKICPALCDFQNCDYKCDDKKLNKYYKNGSYNELDIKDIDYGTYNDNLARNEIDDIKQKIKDLFRFKHVYNYNQIQDNIKKSFKQHQEKLFENYYLDKSLEDLMPKTENDYNNFKNTVYDKYNRTGYLIQRGIYYIFQPFDDNEDLPLYYRENFELDIENNIPIKNYIEQKYGTVEESKQKIENDTNKKKINSYDFESIMSYYNERPENFIVGVIDKSIRTYNDTDLFKVRTPLKKSEQRRGTGIVSIKGAVCFNSKNKEYLVTVIKKLRKLVPFELVIKSKIKREDLCDEIKKALLYLEKYSTTKNKNKMTYVMIPANHPKYEFPYNLEDRIKYILNKSNEITNKKIEHKVIKENNGKNFIIEIKNSKYIEKNISEIRKLGFQQSGSKWIKKID